MMNGSTQTDAGFPSTNNWGDFKGRFIKCVPALRCTVMKWCWGPAKMNGGNYQLYLFTALLPFSETSWGSRTSNLPAQWYDVQGNLLFLLMSMRVFSMRLFNILLLQYFIFPSVGKLKQTSYLFLIWNNLLVLLLRSHLTWKNRNLLTFLVSVNDFHGSLASCNVFRQEVIVKLH